MLITILSIIANITYFVVLNINIYTDQVMMTTGEIQEWHRSLIARLSIADQSFLLCLQIVLAAVSIITSVLYLFGVRSRMIRTIQLVSLTGSAIVFIIIMIVTKNLVTNSAVNTSFTGLNKWPGLMYTDNGKRSFL